MKTILLSIMVLFAATVQGQVEEVAVITGLAFPYQIADEFGYAVNTNGKFTFYNAETNKVSLDITAPKVDGYDAVSFSLVDRYLINTEYTVDYFVTYKNSSNEFVTYLYTQDIPRVFNTVSSVQKVVVDGEYRLLMYSSTNNSTYIYKVSGNPPSPVQETENQTTISAYPNPAQSFLTINYDIKNQNTAQCMIYNASGQLVEHFVVGNAFKHVRLDVASYKPGTYIYSINGVSNRFVVE